MKRTRARRECGREREAEGTWEMDNLYPGLNKGKAHYVLDLGWLMRLLETASRANVWSPHVTGILANTAYPKLNPKNVATAYRARP